MKMIRYLIAIIAQLLLFTQIAAACDPQATGLVCEDFVSVSPYSVHVRPKKLVDDSSVIISGSEVPTASQGGSIAVYGTKATPNNATYAGDVHIFSGGNEIDGYGDVWIGATMNHPTKGVVPQDMMGFRSGHRIEALSHGGFFVYPKLDDKAGYFAVEQNGSPRLILKAGEKFVTFEIINGDLQINGNVNKVVFSMPVEAPNLP